MKRTEGEMMEHTHALRLLPRFIYDELTETECQGLRAHLAACETCELELEELKQLHVVLAQRHTVQPNEHLLIEARAQLRQALAREVSGRTVGQRLLEFLDSIFPSYRIVLGGVGMLTAGLLGGYFWFSSSNLSPVSPNESTSAALPTPTDQGSTHITGLRFIDSDASDGEIEFTFDAVTPMRIKGSVNDDRVQQALAHAMVNDHNPGIRLRSVNAVGAQSLKLPDRELKAALVSALKSDTNPGVRREALRVLQGFQFDEEIKDAFLHALMHDTNSGVRIAAINALDSARVVGTDQELRRVLHDRLKTDNNNYVRIRSKAVLQEIENQ